MGARTLHTINESLRRDNGEAAPLKVSNGIFNRKPSSRSPKRSHKRFVEPERDADWEEAGATLDVEEVMAPAAAAKPEPRRRTRAPANPLARALGDINQALRRDPNSEAKVEARRRVRGRGRVERAVRERPDVEMSSGWEDVTSHVVERPAAAPPQAQRRRASPRRRRPVNPLTRALGEINDCLRRDEKTEEFLKNRTPTKRSPRPTLNGSSAPASRAASGLPPKSPPLKTNRSSQSRKPGTTSPQLKRKMEPATATGPAKRQKPAAAIYRTRATSKKRLDNSWGADVLYEAMTAFESRGIVLLMEKELQHFVMNFSEGDVLVFPTMNSYYRMLIHKVCDRFLLKSGSDGLWDGRAVRVTYTPEAQIPVVSMTDWVVASKQHLCTEALEHYEKTGIKQVTDSFKAQDPDEEYIPVKNAVATRYRWRRILPSADEERWVRKGIQDIGKMEVGPYHICEFQFRKDMKPAEAQELVHKVCAKVIKKDCELILIDERSCLVFLPDRSLIATLISGAMAAGIEARDFISASDETKRRAGFPVKEVRKARDYSAFNRILGRHLRVDIKNKSSRSGTPDRAPRETAKGKGMRSDTIKSAKKQRGRGFRSDDLDMEQEEDPTPADDVEMATEVDPPKQTTTEAPTADDTPAKPATGSLAMDTVAMDTGEEDTASKEEKWGRGEQL